MDAEAGYLVHVEMNGRRELGWILLGRREAVELVLADVAHHQQDGWSVEEFHAAGSSGFVMAKDSDIRRVWTERKGTAEETPPVEFDLRQALADGFRYPDRSPG
jgi:hypothetical protein